MDDCRGCLGTSVVVRNAGVHCAACLVVCPDRQTFRPMGKTNVVPEVIVDSRGNLLKIHGNFGMIYIKRDLSGFLWKFVCINRCRNIRKESLLL